MALAMLVTSLPAQTLPSSGLTTKSLPFSQAVYNPATQEYVDISGSLNVVRSINYGSDANSVILLSELAPNAKATGRNTGIQYCTNGTATVTRRLPPGLISDMATVRLSFPLYPCSGTGVGVEATSIEYTIILAYILLNTVLPQS
jgi:hypothetical protein